MKKIFMLLTLALFILTCPNKSYAEVFYVDMNGAVKPVKTSKKFWLALNQDGPNNYCYEYAYTYVDFSPADENVKYYLWILPIPANISELQVGQTSDFESYVCKNSYSKKQLTYYGEIIDQTIEQPLFASKAYNNIFCDIQMEGVGNLVMPTYVNKDEKGEYFYKHGIIINEEVEVSLVFASNIDALSSFFQKRGANLPQNMKQALETYINKKYTFIVSKINDIRKSKFANYKNDITKELFLKTDEEYKNPNTPNYYPNQKIIFLPRRGIHICYPNRPRGEFYCPFALNSLNENGEFSTTIVASGHKNIGMESSLENRIEKTINYHGGFYGSASDWTTTIIKTQIMPAREAVNDIRIIDEKLMPLMAYYRLVWASIFLSIIIAGKIMYKATLPNLMFISIIITMLSMFKSVTIFVAGIILMCKQGAFENVKSAVKAIKPLAAMLGWFYCLFCLSNFFLPHNLFMLMVAAALIITVFYAILKERRGFVFLLTELVLMVIINAILVKAYVYFH